MRFGLEDLARWAGDLGLELSSWQVEQFRRFLDLLLVWNARIALVSQDSPDEIVCKHFADSLAAASICRRGDRVLDLGSGAGFPAVPVAITHPDVSVSMIEASQKKVSFLLNAVSQLALANARVLEGRIEKLAAASDLEAHFDLAISRALTDLNEFLNLAAPFLTAAGRAVAMKGPRYRDELAVLATAPSRLALVDVIPYRLPDTAERVLLTFRFT